MWKRLGSTTLLTHPRLTVAEDDIVLPNGKKTTYIYYKNTRNAAVVVCFKAGKLLLQKEYSYPIGGMVYQFPGGAQDDGELPVETARRELHEEANLLADNLTMLGSFYVDNRRSNAKMYVYLAEDPKDSRGSPDEEEDILAEWIDIDDFKKMIQQGSVQNATMLAAWSMFMAFER